MPNLVADATTLFIGGIITTAHLISSMMVLFLEHPEQLEKARSNDWTPIFRGPREVRIQFDPIRRGDPGLGNGTSDSMSVKRKQTS